MDYVQTIAYLYARLPMFTRIGASAIKKDLHNTILLCEKAGNPQRKFSSIHVAGTNGKGSVSHMLASVFQSSGYKTGLYTSPHLYDFRERIRVNGTMIPEEKVISFTERFKDYIEEIEPSFFEVTVALAFEHFAEEKVDIAIVETGMGGRLDSTNIIHPLLSVITNIGMDHVQFLGNTIPEIAGEKAGIIKENIPVIIGETHPESAPVFLEKAKEKNSRIVFADHRLKLLEAATSPEGLRVTYGCDTGVSKTLLTDLPGLYQSKNVATVLTALEELRSGFPGVTDTSIGDGLSRVRTQTGLCGRWEVVSRNPMMVLDVGHNEDGIRQILLQLEQISYQKLHLVIGMVKDKDVEKVLALLPKNARYYFTNADIPRALPAEELKLMAVAHELAGEAHKTVPEAVKSARNTASKDDLILVCGSVFVVAEVVQL